MCVRQSRRVYFSPRCARGSQSVCRSALLLGNRFSDGVQIPDLGRQPTFSQVRILPYTARYMPMARTSYGTQNGTQMRARTFFQKSNRSAEAASVLPPSNTDRALSDNGYRGRARKVKSSSFHLALSPLKSSAARSV